MNLKGTVQKEKTFKPYIMIITDEILSSSGLYITGLVTDRLSFVDVFDRQ